MQTETMPTSNTVFAPLVVVDVLVFTFAVAVIKKISPWPFIRYEFPHLVLPPKFSGHKCYTWMQIQQISCTSFLYKLAVQTSCTNQLYKLVAQAS